MPRELSALVVPLRGLLETTGDLFQPYRLVDGDGVAVGPVAAFFAELAACGRPATTQRSYGMDLLRWFRFLWTVGVVWDQATRVEARDFCRWLQVTVKPVRPHWRHRARRPGIGRGACPGAGERGDRQAVTRGPLRGGHGGALRERAALLLRLPPGGRDGADAQPVPAVPAASGPDARRRITIRWSRSPGSAAAGTGRRS